VNPKLTDPKTMNKMNMQQNKQAREKKMKDFFVRRGCLGMREAIFWKGEFGLMPLR